MSPSRPTLLPATPLLLVQMRHRRYRARKGSPTVRVTYLRIQYRLIAILSQRLARWEGVESAVRRLAKHAERHGVSAADKRRAWAAITLLEDTFHVGPNAGYKE